MRFVYVFPLLWTLLWADLPLLIEDLVTQKGKVELETSLSYTNAHSQEPAFGEPVLTQSSTNSFVLLPSNFGETQTKMTTS